MKYATNKNIKILVTLYLNLFYLSLNFESNKILNSSETANQKESKSNKKSLILLVIKTCSICLSIVLGYIALTTVFKIICLKKEVYNYLNKILIKNGFIDEKAISYVIHNLNVNFFFKFIEKKLMNTCKYKDKSIYTRYEAGCSICQGEFEPESKVIITSCEHIYHYECMKEFLNLIEEEMIEKKDEENDSNFLNYFNCPNCKKNILRKKKKSNINDEKYVVEEIKVKQINVINNKINNNITNNITSPDPIKTKDSKSSSSLILSSSINLKQNSLKIKKKYYKKNKIFKKKKFINNSTTNNNNDVIAKDKVQGEVLNN